MLWRQRWRARWRPTPAELARLNPLFIGLETLLREVGTLGEVPLHPGARNAYRALGLMR